MYSGKLENECEDDVDKSVGALLVLDCTIGINVRQIACGGQHCAIVTIDGRVLTWGKGSYGRLGHGHLNPLQTPTIVLALSELFITTINCGFAFTSAITKEGHLYSWGANDNGRLGLGDTEDKSVPVMVASLSDHHISDVRCGSVHSIVLTTKGLVFSYGKGEYTGHASTVDILIPTMLDYFDGIPVIQISTGFGGYHTLALTERGVVYSFGHNRVSQTGLPNCNESTTRNSEGAFYINKPTVVEINEKVKNINCGWGHSIVITESGNAYSCGRNTSGQLGVGNPSLGSLRVNERGHSYQPFFRKITALGNVNEVYAGGEHSIFRVGSTIYSCGSNSRGQLCQSMNSVEDFFYEPIPSKEIKEVGRVINQIECGGEITFFVLGNYIPSSLKEICTSILNQNPEKYAGEDSNMNFREIMNEN